MAQVTCVPQTFVDDTTIGDAAVAAWATPSNAGADDATYTTVNLDGSGSLLDQSHYLKCTNLTNLNTITDGSTINGVRVRVNGSYVEIEPGSNPPSYNNIRLFIGGSYQGDNKALTPVDQNQDTDVNNDFGGAADAWGLGATLTAANVKDSGFGVGVAIIQNGGNGDETTSRIDYVEFLIDYTPGAAVAQTRSASGGAAYSSPFLY